MRNKPLAFKETIDIKMDEYGLKEYFINYLRNVRKLSESSVGHYTQGLTAITKLLKNKKKLIVDSIYEINTLQDLLMIREFLSKDEDFLIKNSVGNNMYSSALNNYIRFAQGDDFFTETYSFTDIDQPMKIVERKTVENYQYRRSSIIKTQSIKAAHFMCECDNRHITFIAKSNNEQYMEGHHLIPLKEQNEFKYSLDIYANIVCICPICHRLLHYGIDRDKRNILESLYKDRYTRLCRSGIEVSKADFLELTMQ